MQIREGMKSHICGIRDQTKCLQGEQNKKERIKTNKQRNSKKCFKGKQNKAKRHKEPFCPSLSYQHDFPLHYNFKGFNASFITTIIFIFKAQLLSLFP